MSAAHQYILTPAIILQIIFLAFRVLPLRILKFLLTSIHALIQWLIMFLVRPTVPHADEGVDREREAEAEAEAGAKMEAEAGVRRLGGVTMTITVLLGEIRLVVVKVTIVALTLWVPFYPSARSFVSLCDRFCRTGSKSGVRNGFAVDIRMGA